MELKRWVQTAAVVQNTRRCINPTLSVFCACYLLLMLIPVNNFCFKSCIPFGWERRNRCSWGLNLWGKLCCSEQSWLQWAPLKDAELWQYKIPAQRPFVKDPQVLPVRIKGCYIYFLSLGGHKPVCCSSDEKNMAHSPSLPVFHRNASRPVYNRAWLDLSWLIGLEHQPFWRILKCRGRVVLSCWCLSSPPVMGRRTHLQAEGICPVGAGRLSVSSETRCAWQPLPRLKARTYSL